MAKFKFILSLWCLFVAQSLCSAQATEIKEAPPSKFQLELVWVVESNPHEFIWQVDGLPNIAFKALAAATLRNWIAKLPAHSTIDWYPSDVPIGGEPAPAEVEEFQAFCAGEDVKFVTHHSG